MPVWLSFLLAVLATVGFFGTIFGAVVAVVEARRAKAKPSMGVVSGAQPGTLTFWATWDPEVFDVQVYRFRVNFVSPDFRVKEGTFTYTLDPVVKAPFSVTVELPPLFKELVESGERTKNALITFDMRTVEELTVICNLTLNRVRKIYHGKAGHHPASGNQLKTLSPDVATTMTLDYQELVTRRKKLRDLEAAAKAKAAAKPAAPAKPVGAPAATVEAPKPA